MMKSNGSDSPTLSEALNEHRYPRILHGRPGALRTYFAAVHLTTLRSWYVRRVLKRLVDGIHDEATVVDIGCGSGDHLFYVLRRRPDVRGVGIDRSAHAVALCRNHAEGTGCLDVEFWRHDVDEDAKLPPNDLTLCIGMLQYVERDGSLLRSVRRALGDDGRLLLYVPVRNERIWSIYERVVEGGRLDYDVVQRRRRVYEPARLRELLAEAGLEVEREELSYGLFGKMAFEIHALILHGLARRGTLPKAAAGVAGVMVLPFLFVLMLADYWLPVTRGNGMLVTARSRQSSVPRKPSATKSRDGPV